MRKKRNTIIIAVLSLILTCGALVYAKGKYYNLPEAQSYNDSHTTNGSIEPNKVQIRVFTPNSPKKFESSCDKETKEECRSIWNKDCQRMFGLDWRYDTRKHNETLPVCENPNYDGRTIYMDTLIW
jgi:hypothetical protein